MPTADILPDDHPVVRQFNAYNAHRLDDFVHCFAPSIRLTRSDAAGNSFEAIVSYRLADGEILEMTVLD